MKDRRATLVLEPSKSERTSQGVVISIFAGPSGGHLYPAFAFAEVLREKWPQSRLLLVTSQRGEALVSKLLPGVFDKTEFIHEFSVPERLSFRTLGFLLQLTRAFISAYRYLSHEKPVLCAGFGSFVSFPAMRLAKSFNIPTMIHEQNRALGKANRWLARHVTSLSISFEDTSRIPASVRAQRVGFPLRKALRRPLIPKVQNSRFVLLIVGGSQGAHRLNEFVLSTFLEFSLEKRAQMAVIHITGAKDYDWICQEYRKLQLDFKAYPYFEHMQELYEQADMAITRAGAGTLFELAQFRIPTVVIPYPHAGSHQTKNADYFLEHQALISISEEEANAGQLKEQIEKLVTDSPERQKMSERIGKLTTPDAAQELFEIAQGLLKDKES